jgi:hypothetical protein
MIEGDQGCRKTQCLQATVRFSMSGGPQVASVAIEVLTCFPSSLVVKEHFTNSLGPAKAKAFSHFPAQIGRREGLVNAIRARATRLATRLLDRLERKPQQKLTAFDEYVAKMP